MEAVANRQTPCHPGQSLLVKVESSLYPVLDISIDGISLQCGKLKKGDIFSVEISSIFSVDDSVDGVCEVVHADGYKAHARFVRPTFRLMRYIIGHLADVAGVEPYYLKRSRAAGKSAG